MQHFSVVIISSLMFHEGEGLFTVFKSTTQPADDQHVIVFAVLLQLTQQTYSVTPDKKDSVPPMSAANSGCTV